MDSTDRRAELALAGLVRLLERCGEGRWLNWARGHLETASSGQLSPTVLDAYGGMGSFNDLILDPVNGHALDRMQVPWANRLLAVLGERIYQLGVEVTDERFVAQWVYPEDPPIEGWRCLACGHGEITDYDIEWWAARIFVPAHVADSSLDSDPDLVDTILSGQVIGAAASRGDVMTRANASGVHIAYRDGMMRPCPACGSADTSVYRWIFAGGGLHAAEDNPQLREPGHQHRAPHTLSSVTSTLEEAGCTPLVPGLRELTDREYPELLDTQTAIMESVRGLDGTVYLAVYEDVTEEAARDAWQQAGEHTWLIPETMDTRVMLETSLEQGVWQLYVTEQPVPAADLPDLFRGESDSLQDTLARLGIVALIDAWHDSTEWRVGLALSAQ